MVIRVFFRFCWPFRTRVGKNERRYVVVCVVIHSLNAHRTSASGYHDKGV